MKISTIRKALIKQSIIVSILLTVFGGGAWYLSSLDEESDRDINNLKSVSDSIAKQAIDLSLEYNKVTNDMSFYSEIKQKQDNKSLTISKAALRDVISDSRSKFALDSLDVKMDEVKLMEGEYKREAVTVESSNVTIGLTSISDVDILGLIAQLSKSYWGFKVTSLKLSLAKELDNAALISIKDTGFAPVVTGKLTFTLFGLRNNAKAVEGDLLTEGATPANPTGSPIQLRHP